MKSNFAVSKQGACGSFCIKYWLGDGCDDDCPSDNSPCKRKKKANYKKK